MQEVIICMNIMIFGDSITYGAWDEKGGWVQRLRKYIESKDPLHKKGILVYNCGVSGDTTSSLVARFEKEAKLRLDDSDNVIIFSIGTNDCLYLNKDRRPNISEKIFEKNIKKLISVASKIPGKIIFTGLTPVDESKMNPLKWDPQFAAKNVYIEKYDGIVKSVCARRNISFVEMFSKFGKKGYEKLLEDGSHPNSKGHEVIFRIVKDFLIKEKIIQ